MGQAPSIRVREIGRPLEDTHQELAEKRDAVEHRAGDLVTRYRRGEAKDYWWHKDRGRFERQVLGIRKELRGDYPYGVPEELDEPLSEIEFERLRFYSEIGWDRHASLLARDYLSRYPQSAHSEEARQRFLLRDAPSAPYAFFHTATLEAGDTPWLVASIGAALGAVAYFLRSGRQIDRLRFRNPWLIASIAAGSMTASLLYAIRPGAPGFAHTLGWFGLTPGRTWRAEANRHLYGEEGDLLYAALNLMFRVGVAAAGVGLMAKSAMPIASFLYRTLTKIPKTSEVGMIRFHAEAIGSTFRDIVTATRDFTEALFTSTTPWKRMGRWFWADLPTPMAQYTARFVRVGGGIGALVNVTDLMIDDDTKQKIAGYQVIRLAGGALMTVALVEF